MKILIINLHSNHNAGDHVLLQVALQQLYAAFPGCTITLAMNDPASYTDPARHEQVVASFFAWFKMHKSTTRSARVGHALQMLWLVFASLVVGLGYRLTGRTADGLLPAVYRPTLRAYTEADLVVSCPGNFIYSRAHNGGIAFLGPFFTIAYAWLVHKPIHMLPQTIGPLWRAWERGLTRWLLARVRVILLRDPTSVELMQTLGIDASCYHLTPDIAFLFEGAPAEAASHFLRCHGIDAQDRPRLGVTLINWGEQHPNFRHQARYEQAVAATIRAFLRVYGGCAVLFPQVCGPTPADDDRIPARRVAAHLRALGVETGVVVIEDETSPQLLSAAYGQMDLFLGSRLHSNIFALTWHTPVIAIAYQSKTHGVMQMLGLSAWVLDIEAVAAEPLTELVQRIWPQREQLRHHIQTQVGLIQQAANQTGAWLRTDFDRLNDERRKTNEL